MCDKHGIEYYFKASYDKANRTSAGGKRGVGLPATMEDFIIIKDEFNVKTLTDVHNQNEILKIAAYYDGAVDVHKRSVPAFLCRQTDLIKAASKTGKIVNIKKGQFLAILGGGGCSRHPLAKQLMQQKFDQREEQVLIQHFGPTLQDLIICLIILMPILFLTLHTAS